MADKGKFIVFEGTDGSGKSTQMKLLGKFLKGKGIDCILTHEPTDSPFGALLRACLTGRIETDERAIAAGDLSSLEHCPFLLGSPQDIDGRIADLLFRRAGFEPKVTARSDNVLTLLELCHYGMGACLCPERFLPALLDGERLRTLRVLDCGPDTAYAIQFGVPATSYRWSVIDDFIRCAREVTTGVSQ